MNRPHDTDTARPPVLTKRRFLKQLVCGSLLAATTPSIAKAALRHYAPPPRTLALQRPHTGDAIQVTYFDQGRYLDDALSEVDYLLRDSHTDELHPIDPALLDQLYDLSQWLGIRQPIEVVSGYRSPFTNAQLRRQSHGVAKHSLHMEGRAIDIRIEGVPTAVIRQAAVAMQRGGVGYYPHADFVHLDTGDIRLW